MCKRSIADCVPQSCDCSFPDNSWAVVDMNAAIDEIDSFYASGTLGRMLEATATDDMDEIKPQICSLTNDILPVFELQNICICKQPDKQYCYLPSKIAELQAADEALERVPDWECCSAAGITNEVPGTIIRTWDHEPGNMMLHSAMQLATRMITHDNALPLWAGLMDCARSDKEDAGRSTTRFRACAGERVDAAKKREVLDYLHQAADNIRVHLKPFYEGEVETMAGFCCAFPLEQDDDSGKQPDRPEFYHGWQDGKPALKEDYFVHLYMDIHLLIDFDMWTNCWRHRTVADLRQAMLQFATALCHQFAHAMADISQNGGESPRFSDEAVVEPGFAWEQFVFGSRLNPDGNSGFWVAPWPDYSTEQFCANGADKLDLCAFGRAALPPQGVSVVEGHVWQQVFEQRFWYGIDSDNGALRKLWLRGANAGVDQSHCNAREVVSRRLCLRAAEARRLHAEAIQSGEDDAMARIVDEADESQDMCHESQDDLPSEISSGSWWLQRWMSMPDCTDDA